MKTRSEITMEHQLITFEHRLSDHTGDQPASSSHSSSSSDFWYPITYYHELLLLHNQLVFLPSLVNGSRKFSITLSLQTVELLRVLKENKVKHLLNPVNAFESTTLFTCDTNLLLCNKQLTNSWEVQLNCDLATIREILLFLAEKSPLIIILDSTNYVKLRNHLATKPKPVIRSLMFSLNGMSKATLKVPKIALDEVFYGLLQLRMMSSSRIALTPSPAWDLPLLSTFDIRSFVTLQHHEDDISVPIPLPQSNYTVKNLELLKHEVSYLIGVNGQRITQIRSLTNCVIKIDTVKKSTLSLLNMVKARNMAQKIQIIGTRAQILHATSIINHHLEEYKNNSGKFS